MPRQPESFEGAVAKSIAEWLDTYMPAVAESLGPLPDTVVPSNREKLERWNLRTDKVPPGPMTDALADQALQAILEEHQQAGSPLPDPDTLTKLVAAKTNAVLYEYRAPVYSTGIPKPAAKVKEAERFARLASKQAADPTIETLPQQAPVVEDAATPPADPLMLPEPAMQPMAPQPMAPQEPAMPPVGAAQHPGVM